LKTNYSLSFQQAAELCVRKKVLQQEVLTSFGSHVSRCWCAVVRYCV